MWGEFVSLFYPRVCISCKTALNSVENHLCLPCTLNFPRTNYHLEPNNPFFQRISLTSQIQCAFALLKYQRKGVAQKILKEIKYKNNQELAYYLGYLYGLELANSGFKGNFDFIVPIPLHPNKLRRRGYNQSASIAEGLANALETTHLPNLISRIVDTSTQTKKGKAERWQNTTEIFLLDKGININEKHILIVDDVITTGATVESAIEVVNEGKPQSISICALATGQ